MSETENVLKEHPIKLTHVGVKQLHIKSFVIPRFAEEIQHSAITLQVAVVPYNAETNTFSIGLAAKVGQEKDTDELPYYLNVEIMGFFEVSPDHFPVDRLPDWVRDNGIYLLYPYLREQMYSLTQRAGYQPLVMALITIPAVNL